MGFQRFESKLVIVTGADSGMGAVTARRFRDEGAAVVLTGRPREKLTNVVSQFDQGRTGTSALGLIATNSGVRCSL